MSHGIMRCQAMFGFASSCSGLDDWSLQSELQVESGSGSVREGSLSWSLTPAATNPGEHSNEYSDHGRLL